MVGKGIVGACEGGFLLVTRVDRNLEKSRISIQVTEERMLSQSLQYSVKKGKGKIVFPTGVIEFSIISVHMPSHDRFGLYELTFFVLNNGHAPLLRNYLNRTNPITIRN